MDMELEKLIEKYGDVDVVVVYYVEGGRGGGNFQAFDEDHIKLSDCSIDDLTERLNDSIRSAKFDCIYADRRHAVGEFWGYTYSSDIEEIDVYLLDFSVEKEITAEDRNV